MTRIGIIHAGTRPRESRRAIPLLPARPRRSIYCASVKVGLGASSK
jgi:hypothetical protein